MSYKAYVVKVDQLRPHTNADRLQIATFFGNDTIVDLKVKAGDCGVYFPSDGQLSERFCQVNNLVRRKDENGNEVGGYLDPVKRNIKPLKLRGEKSDGLYLPLTCLADFCAISDLKPGDTIDVVNGEEICRKYIPRQAKTTGKSGSGRNRTAKANIAPTFYEHVETEQLAYNLNKFKAGDVVQLTLKMHGCFAYDTRVRMANGKQKRIQNIKPGDKVLAYNFETGRFESADVIKTFRNDPSNEWRKVKISRDHIRGDKRGSFKCTPNHPFWVEEQKRWVEAKDLTPGMDISCAIPSLIMTEQQKDIVIGNLLGDGYVVDFDHKTAEVQTSSKDECYIDYLVGVSGGLYKKSPHVYMSGYETKVFRARTTRSADLFNYLDRYISWSSSVKENRLKPEFVDAFSPLSLAIMYMDDGSLSHSDVQRDRASFAICNFNEHDANIICDCFRKFDIEPTLYLSDGEYYRIRLNTAEAYKMFNLIKKYIPPCMAYKLPEEIRNTYVYDRSIANTLPAEQGFVFTKQSVLSNEEIIAAHGWYEYDLQTSLGNYMVGYSIVHNTSGRTGYLPLVVEGKRTLLQKLLRKHPHTHLEYGYITGTRRVVLANGHTGGWYESDDFRHAMAKKFEGKLLRGEVVYYEIVGFQGPNGAPIMGQVQNSKIKDKEFSKRYGDVTTFSYGCDQSGNYDTTPPCCEVYVYRMTMVNEDGDVVEYSPAQIKYRCEQMGVQTVMEFETFVIPQEIRKLDDNGDIVNMTAGEYVVRKVEKYFDGPDPIGKTHVREGVVARILNRNNFAVYKHKNFSFKILSGIAVDELSSEQADTIDQDILEEM